MKRLDLILNGKGGVGKSFFAVNFVQYLKDKGIKHVAIDSDNENSTLNRFHPDASFIDLADRRGLDGVFNLLEKSNLVAMDCRAASTDLFTDFFEAIDLSTVLSGMGAALTLVMPVNHEADSVDQVQRLADKLGELGDNKGILDSLEKQLMDINSALEKIRKGTYGICEVSGEPIERERLEANPAARTSIKHMQSTGNPVKS